MSLTTERVTLNPITEDPTLEPLDLVGTDRSWGLYLLEHDYTPPELDTQKASSVDTEGDLVVSSRYQNRTITAKVRVFEPPDLAATNLATNPKGEVVKKWTDGPDFPVTREAGTAAIPAYRGDYRDKHAFDGSGTDNTMGSIAVTFPSEGIYICSVMVWIPSSYDGGGILMPIEAATGSSLKRQKGLDYTLRDQWQRTVYTLEVKAADLTGIAFLRCVGGMPSSAATGVIYTDAFQIEKLDPAVYATRTNLVTNPWAKNDLTGIAKWFESPAPVRITGAEPATKYGAAIQQTHDGTKSYAGVTVPGGTLKNEKTYSVGAWVKVPGEGFYRVDFRKTDSSKSATLKLNGQITAEMKANTWYFWEADGYTPDATWEANAVLSKFTTIAGTVPVNWALGAAIVWGGFIVEEAAEFVEPYFPTDTQLTAKQVAYAGVAGNSASYFLSGIITPYEPTAYFDGDTPGCDWSGARYASTSTRPPPDGTRFSRIVRDVTAQLDRIKREKSGTWRRYSAAGGPITFDLVSAKVPSAPQGLDIARKRMDIDLSFEARPGGRGAEVQLGGNYTEEALPALVFLAENVPGELPAFGRLQVEERQGQAQLAALWGLQQRYYSNSANAALFYEAETRTPLGSSAKAALAGASGAGENTVRNASLVNGYQGVLSTQAAAAGAHLSHIGSYRVLARVHRPEGNTGEVSLKFTWTEGDFVNTTEGETIRYGVNDREGVFTLEDFGVVTINQVAAGATQRWEGRWSAKSTVKGDQVYIDCIMLVPIDEGSGEARAADAVSEPTTLLGYDAFNQEAGVLAAKTADIGGVWAGFGSANDFSVVAGTSHWAQRTALSDASNTGRYEILGAQVYTDVAARVRVESLLNPSTAASWMGLVLRWIDINNWFRLLFVPGAIYKGQTIWYLIAQKRVLGTVTNYGTFGKVTGGGIKEASYGVPVAGLVEAIITADGTWKVGVDGVIYKTGSDAALGPAGALKEGKVGIIDEQLGATADTRIFDNFEAWVPVVDRAMFPNRQLEIDSDRARREDSAGATWGEAPYEGDYLLVPPAGREKRVSRLIVKGSRHPEADQGIDDIRARLYVTPRYLIAPPT